MSNKTLIEFESPGARKSLPHRSERRDRVSHFIMRKLTHKRRYPCYTIVFLGGLFNYGTIPLHLSNISSRRWLFFGCLKWKPGVTAAACRVGHLVADSGLEKRWFFVGSDADLKYGRRWSRKFYAMEIISEVVLFEIVVGHGDIDVSANIQLHLYNSVVDCTVNLTTELRNEHQHYVSNQLSL